MRNGKWTRWEMALALSLCITLCHGMAVQWWGVIFPGLAPEDPPAQVETVLLDGAPTVGGVQVRLWFLDWLRELFEAEGSPSGVE